MLFRKDTSRTKRLTAENGKKFTINYFFKKGQNRL